MAIFHSRVKTFSRARGDSSVAAAAYRGGLFLIDHLTGKHHDYRRRGGVVETFCIVPEDAPDWAVVPSELWSAAEAAETRRNSTVAREFEVALPHELNDERRSDLAEAIGHALVGRYGFALQASIHSPGSRDGLNHHVHLLATTRRLTSEGFGEKTRELDGGVSGKTEIEWVRKTIASTINEHLASAGFDIRIDHRRLEVQAESAMERGAWGEAIALSRTPTKHVGRTASALERKGVMTDRAADNARVVLENEEAFERLLEKAMKEGRAAPVPAGHSQAQAQKDGQERGSPHQLPVSPVRGLVVHGISGIRASSLVGRGVHVEAQPGPQRSIRDLLAIAAQELAEIFAVRQNLALTTTRQLLGQLRNRIEAIGDDASLRRDLNGLLNGLGRLKRRLMRFSSRLAALRRAEQLFHMAEQSWERFDADFPRTGGVWSTQEWERRRARRLAALQKRTVELRGAREVTSDLAEAACEEEVLAAAAQLEQLSEQVSKRQGHRAEYETAERVALPGNAVRARRPRL
ncbi:MULTISPECIES: MobA/MobL family protein [unclassified Pseudoxanthomonas]|uniref:MobA/MobL family protein n=1 Tax=unclassified Pseudoxanthomonas TaxID=2645906 RepID=UPI0008EEEA8D|nr:MULTISPECIES: MobA/MobL family protein [unclassified Pseudoxanthomonas]PPJ42331.1 plasmid mobilization protein [Pseudoxanthomonas sp. KAs_5_3]SFV27721.1 plasmid mobilization system relaxase [Pseudoxanthomonas sp. YR558]